MSQKANPTLIGLFIVIGLVLGVAGILLFSSAKLFTATHEYVLYFDSSLNGLNESAPVKYRGVTIGSVKRVMIHFNQATNDFSMPVIIEIQDNLFRGRLGKEVLSKDISNVETGISRGLRATLEAESLLTGVLYVNLDTIENGPPPRHHQIKPLYAEIPTQTPEIQQLMKNLARLDIKGLEEKITALATNISSTLDNLNTRGMSQQVTNLLTSLNRLVTSPEITNTLAVLPGTVAQYRLLAEKLNSRVDPLADNVTNTLAQATQTLMQLRGGMQDLRAFLSPDSPVRNDLGLALEQIATAAQSISALADFLHAHPNALITGRADPDQKP
jgi:paraquat-inducible protein B